MGKNVPTSEKELVEVHLTDEPLARGVGRTKRAAERLAATEALGMWQPPKTAKA